MSEDDTEKGSSDAADQGGEGNEGEGPDQREQAADAPAPTHHADDGPAEDFDVEEVERGDADAVGTPAEEVQRAERREREAGEG